MARRRNSIAKRFAKMRGLPPGEKALLQRVADLMDAALNNRQSSNPFEESSTRINRQVYPPTGLLAQQGVSSTKLIWDAANSNEHLRYEIIFINMTTGEQITKISYTNNIIFRGANGTYLAKVASVGRDGSRSSIKQVEFGIGNDVMLIEGAKNGPLELGTMVQDNIKLYKDFSIYVWGHVVLDKQTLDTNNNVVFRLWRADYPNAVIGDSYLVQTVTLYSATESGNSLDTTARAGLIQRPAAARIGTFETTQSIMFSPIEVLDEDDELEVTFFLETLNRTEEDDEVNLSLVMWAGQDGVGSAVPGDTWEPPTPYVFPHLNSFHNQAPGWQQEFPYDTRDACAYIPDGYSMVGNEWTIAMWFRLDDSDAVKMSTAPAKDTNPNGGDVYLFSRGAVRTDENQSLNSWRFTIHAAFNPGEGAYQHFITTKIGWFTAEANPTTVGNTYIATCYGDRDQLSYLFPYGDAIDSSQDSGNHTNNGWMFIVFCWTGGFHQGGVPKLRTYMNTAQAGLNEGPLVGEPRMELIAPAGNDQTYNPCVQTDQQALSYQFALENDSLASGKHWAGYYTGDLNEATCTNRQMHLLGIWNKALDSDQSGKGWNIGPINALFNKGRSGVHDWKEPIETAFGDSFPWLNYGFQENLIHQIQFGAVEKAFSSNETLRDTGYFLPGGDLNFTAGGNKPAVDGWHEQWHQLAEGPHQGWRDLATGWYEGFGNSWSRGTDIYDILSPTGSNNTTQYNYAYPGQNMSVL